MRKRFCNFCKNELSNLITQTIGGVPQYAKGVGWGGGYDLCDNCVKVIRRVICRHCLGTGRIRVRDDEATDAQATCGESRTQYKTIICRYCSEVI